MIGLLSGTSMDGIDVAAAEIRLDSGVVQLRPLGHTETEYPADLRHRLVAALPPGTCDAGELCALDTQVGQAFADAAVRGIHGLAGGSADLVASLGQTLFHWVDGGRARGTLQLGQPAWIAEATGLPVVSDLRTRDVAAGGHGAPLAGILDALWLSSPGAAEPKVALNIGGIANITVVNGTRPLSYDVGPGNALLDAAASVVSGGRAARDTGGHLAASGSVVPELLNALLADPYYRAPPPKSTGKEHFNGQYLRRVLADFPAVSGPDLLATLTELTATTVADACRQHGARKVVAAGGGVHNPTLMAALARRLAGPELVTSDDFGLPADGKEAYLAALLGALTFHGLPGNVPSTTGARGPRLLGAITPGAEPLSLPPPATAPVKHLRVLSREEPPCAPST